MGRRFDFEKDDRPKWLCYLFGKFIPSVTGFQSRLSTGLTVSVIYEWDMVWSRTFFTFGHHTSGYESLADVRPGSDAGTQGIRALFSQV
jgi:hypothetical protein